MPKLEESIGLYDTCGVHNLHGMPGVLGGLASVITAGFATHALYGDNIGDVYPKMGSDGRSASQQAVSQLLALLITLGIAMISGTITGYLLKSVREKYVICGDNFLVCI
jgi:ammonium transporter Rh